MFTCSRYGTALWLANSIPSLPLCRTGLGISCKLDRLSEKNSHKEKTVIERIALLIFTFIVFFKLASLAVGSISVSYSLINTLGILLRTDIDLRKPSHLTPLKYLGWKVVSWESANLGPTFYEWQGSGQPCHSFFCSEPFCYLLYLSLSHGEAW